MPVTNGDAFNLAKTRLNESINAMAKLGLSKEKIYYLSYGDYNVLTNAFYSEDPNRVFLSQNGITQETYGFPELLNDYHYRKFGVHASYCRQNITADFYDVINNFRPDDIYMPSSFELRHGDHSATALFTIESLIKIKRTSQYSPVLHEWMIDKEGLPQSHIDYNSLPNPFSNIEADMDNTSPYNWGNRESVSVPAEMYALMNPQKIDRLTSITKITADDSI